MGDDERDAGRRAVPSGQPTAPARRRNRPSWVGWAAVLVAGALVAGLLAVAPVVAREAEEDPGDPPPAPCTSGEQTCEQANTQPPAAQVVDGQPSDTCQPGTPGCQPAPTPAGGGYCPTGAAGCPTAEVVQPTPTDTPANGDTDGDGYDEAAAQTMIDAQRRRNEAQRALAAATDADRAAAEAELEAANADLDRLVQERYGPATAGGQQPAGTSPPVATPAPTPVPTPVPTAKPDPADLVYVPNQPVTQLAPNPGPAKPARTAAPLPTSTPVPAPPAADSSSSTLTLDAVAGALTTPAAALEPELTPGLAPATAPAPVPVPTSAPAPDTTDKGGDLSAGLFLSTLPNPENHSVTGSATPAPPGAAGGDLTAPSPPAPPSPTPVAPDGQPTTPTPWPAPIPQTGTPDLATPTADIPSSALGGPVGLAISMDVGTPAEGTAGEGTGVVALPAGAVRHATEPDLVLPPELAAAGYAETPAIDLRWRNAANEGLGAGVGSFIGTTLVAARAGWWAPVIGLVGGVADGGITMATNYWTSPQVLLVKGPDPQDPAGWQVCRPDPEQPAQPAACTPYLDDPTTIPFDWLTDRPEKPDDTPTAQFDGAPVDGLASDVLAPREVASYYDARLIDAAVNAAVECIPVVGLAGAGPRIPKIKNLVPSGKAAVAYCGGGIVGQALATSQRTERYVFTYADGSQEECSFVRHNVHGDERTYRVCRPVSGAPVNWLQAGVSVAVNIAIALVANRIGIAIRERAWPNPKTYGPAPVRPPVQPGEPMLEGRFRPGNEVTKAPVSFWLATAKGNVPVKLRVSVDGDAMFVNVVVIGRNDVPAKTGLAQPMLALFKTLKAEAKGLGFKRLVVTADRAPAKWGGTAAVPDRHWFFDWDLGD